MTSSSLERRAIPQPAGRSSGLDHVTSAAIDEAAAWLASRPPHQHPHPIVPALKKLFGLTASEACQAIRRATLQHGRSK